MENMFAFLEEKEKEVMKKSFNVTPEEGNWAGIEEYKRIMNINRPMNYEEVQECTVFLQELGFFGEPDPCEVGDCERCKEQCEEYKAKKRSEALLNAYIKQFAEDAQGTTNGEEVEQVSRHLLLGAVEAYKVGLLGFYDFLELCAYIREF